MRGAGLTRPRDPDEAERIHYVEQERLAQFEANLAAARPAGLRTSAARVPTRTKTRDDVVEAVHGLAGLCT